MVAERRKRIVAPYVTAAILLLGVGVWARHDYLKLHEFRQAEMRQFADGLYHSLRAQWEGMGPEADFAAEGRKLTDALLASTPQLLGVRLELPGQENIEAGLIRCHECDDSSTLGERVAFDAYWFWRPLGEPSTAPIMPNPQAGPAPFEPGPAPPNLVGPAPSLGMQPQMASAVPPVLWLGLAKELPAPFREAELRSLVIRFSIALAAILLLSIAWLQSIKSRALANQLRLEQSRRSHLEELSLAAAGLAHETKNPLGVIRGLAQRLGEDPSVTDSVRDSAERMMDAADQATSRLGEFISFARVRQPRMSAVALDQAIAHACLVLEGDLQAGQVSLVQQTRPAMALADPDMLLQILLNLLLNAVQASPPGGTIVVELASQSGGLCIRVKDTGRGIPAALLDEVFKPYVTGREGGHGLGLTIVRRLAESMGWDILLQSQEGKGTTATICTIQPASTKETP